MDIVQKLRGATIVMTENGYTSISKMGGAMLNEAADEIERLRRDVEEANARAYIMAKEITLWQSQAALKENK